LTCFIICNDHKLNQPTKHLAHHWTSYIHLTGPFPTLSHPSPHPPAPGMLCVASATNSPPVGEASRGRGWEGTRAFFSSFIFLSCSIFLVSLLFLVSFSFFLFSCFFFISCFFSLFISFSIFYFFFLFLLFIYIPYFFCHNCGLSV
jgi:hypothetical protein